MSIQDRFVNQLRGRGRSCRGKARVCPEAAEIAGREADDASARVKNAPLPECSLLSICFSHLHLLELELWLLNGGL